MSYINGAWIAKPGTQTTIYKHGI